MDKQCYKLIEGRESVRSRMERLTYIILFINILFARLVFCQWFFNKAISLIWDNNLKQNRIMTNYDNLKLKLILFAYILTVLASIFTKYQKKI